MSYTETFTGTANPLPSPWRCGAVVGTDWTNPQKGAFSGGGNAAFATQVAHSGAPFNDSVACIDPSFEVYTPDQEVICTLSQNAATNELECELFVRMRVESHNIRGYEGDVVNGGTLFVVRWNGTINDFTHLDAGGISLGALSAGDKFRLRVIGKILTVDYAPVATGIFANKFTHDLSTDDFMWTKGQPGMGFYTDTSLGTPSATNTFGWADFTSNSLGDSLGFLTLPAIEQSVYAHNDGTGIASISATLFNVAAGSTIIDHVGWDNTGTPTCTASDGTAYTASTEGKVTDAVAGENGEVFRRWNVGAGTHTVVNTFSASTASVRMRLLEISGLTLTDPLDKSTGQSQTAPGTGANAVSSGATATTTNANDLILGLTQDTTELDPGSGTISAGTGFVLQGPTSIIMAAAAKNVSATGAQTATFTQSVNNNRITHVLALMAAPPPPPPSTLMGQVQL